MASMALPSAAASSLAARGQSQRDLTSRTLPFSLRPSAAGLCFPAPVLGFPSVPLAPVNGGALVVKAQAVEQEALLGSSSGGFPPAAAAEGTKLYVGNLPWNVDSATLADIFQDAGVVEEVEVICDRDTGRSRGFAFVVMSTPEDAQAAIERFDGSDLGGRVLRVNYPAPPGQRRQQQQQPRQRRQGGGGGTRYDNPNKLYVGNLSWGVDDVALQNLFSEFGQVLEARVVLDRDSGRSKGFGFVTLADQEAVSSAVSNLNGAEFDGRQLRVNPAGQRPE